MKHPFAGVRGGLCAVLVLGALLAAHADAQSLQGPQLRADLDAAVEVITHQHPDYRHSTDPAAFKAKVAEIRARLNHAMTQEQAWHALSALNPLLADGHL